MRAPVRVRLHEADGLHDVHAAVRMRSHACLSEGLPVEIAWRLDPLRRDGGSRGAGHAHPVYILAVVALSALGGAVKGEGRHGLASPSSSSQNGARRGGEHKGEGNGMSRESWAFESNMG